MDNFSLGAITVHSLLHRALAHSQEFHAPIVDDVYDNLSVTDLA